jgi:hypothetical protein
MKTKNKILYSHLKGLFRFKLIPYTYEKIIRVRGQQRRITVNPISAMIARNRGLPMVAVILRLLPAMGGKTSLAVVTSIKTVLRRLSQLMRSQGIKGLVKYLKNVSVLTQQCIAGHKGTVLSPRVKTTKSGIPLVFPPVIRRGIRALNGFHIRFALTMASLYRDLVYSATPNISTITKPFSGQKNALVRVETYIPTFVKNFCPQRPVRNKDNLMGTFVWFPILKSSPQTFGPISSTNVFTLMRSAAALTAGQITNLLTLGRLSISGDANGFAFFSAKLFLARELGQALSPLFQTDGFTGKLGFKMEAAGKVRVFAMLDPWTQLIMYPFHKYLFGILSHNKLVDGTFNQLDPIRRIRRGKPLYSMDLSAATDRLPVSLQRSLIQKVFNLSDLEASAWSELLVDRAFKVNHRDLPIKSVRYSVGQPMGALSSWAMLAMTHHLIVQYSASLVYGDNRFFTDYAILGDDLVIFNHKVAKAYHKIIDSLGVECNLAKSVLSPKGLGLEFAKRTFLLGRDVSPTPLKELASSLSSVAGMMEYSKKWKLTIPGVLRAAGFGYRVIGSCNKPFNKLSTKVRYLVLGMGMMKGTLTLSETFAHLRRGYSTALLESAVSQFVNEYLITVIGRVMQMSLSVRDMEIGKVRPLIKEVKTILNTPKRKYSGDITFPIEFAVQQRLGFVIQGLVAKLHKLQDELREGPQSCDAFFAIMIKVMKVEAQALRFIPRDLHLRADPGKTGSKRPGAAKLFRQHQAFTGLFDALRKHDGRLTEMLIKTPTRGLESIMTGSALSVMSQSSISPLVDANSSLSFPFGDTLGMFLSQMLFFLIWFIFFE